MIRPALFSNRVTLWIAILLLTILTLFSLTGVAPVSGNNVDKEKTAVTFVHLTDIHYNAKGIDNSWRLLKDSPVLLETALKDIREISDLDFIFLGGDSVDYPNRENLEGLYSLLHRWNQLPFYMALGNHDVGVKPGLTKQYTINAFRQYGGNKSFPVEDKGWYSFTPQPWLRLIVMDATTDETVTANGTVPQEELDWVERELDEAEKKEQMVIVLSHFPLVEPFHSKTHEILKPGSEKLLAILEKRSNFVAYFAGHYHSAKIARHNGIYYVTTPALVEYPNAYRVVSVTKGGKLSITWKPTSLTGLSLKSLQRSPHHKTALGNPQSDHNLMSGTLRYHPPICKTECPSPRDSLKSLQDKR